MQNVLLFTTHGLIKIGFWDFLNRKYIHNKLKNINVYVSAFATFLYLSLGPNSS